MNNTDDYFLNSFRDSLHISIVLYKTDINLVEKCINSIFSFGNLPYVTIIDNSPVPTKLDFIKNFNIRYLHNPSNPGYGASHNIAILASIASSAKYHLVCNADIYFTEDVINTLTTYMEKNPDVALVMPKVLNPDGSIQYLCKLVPTPLDLFARRFFTKKFIDKYLIDFELKKYEYKYEIFVPYLSGCFMFLRVDCLKLIGAFDERFFMYPEDIDLTRRLAVRYKTTFYPQCSVYHEYGGASKKSFHMFFIHAWNLIKYFNKWGWFFDEERVKLNLITLSQNITTQNKS